MDCLTGNVSFPTARSITAKPVRKSKVVWCEGNFRVYEEQRHARLGAEADQPHRVKYRKMS